MKNSDFIKLVVRCRNCIHRGTDVCPMLEDYYNIGFQEWEQIDKTEDEGFCHLGERDTNEETLQQEERNNFLTSVMQNIHQRFFY
jgi:hypothetical protein